MKSVSFGNGGFLVKLRGADALTHWDSAELSLVHALPMCSNIDVTSTDARSILEYWTPNRGTLLGKAGMFEHFSEILKT